MGKKLRLVQSEFEYSLWVKWHDFLLLSSGSACQSGTKHYLFIIIHPEYAWNISHWTLTNIQSINLEGDAVRYSSPKQIYHREKTWNKWLKIVMNHIKNNLLKWKNMLIKNLFCIQGNYITKVPFNSRLFLPRLLAAFLEGILSGTFCKTCKINFISITLKSWL